MRWNIIVECVGEDGRQSTITLGTVERLAGSTTAENLGVNLQESKQIDLISHFLDANASLNYIQNLHVLGAIRSWPTGQAGCLNLVCAKS